MGRIIGLLPSDAVAILKAASQVGTPGSVQRTVAIEQANERVRSLYPHLFRKEPMKIQLNNVRLAFANTVFTKEAFPGEPEDKAEYSVVSLLGPDHPQLPEIEAALLTVAKEKWGAKGQAVYDELKKKDKLALHDGDTKADVAGHAGNFFVRANNKVRPTVVDRDRSILAESDGRIYSGCIANVIVEFWAQDNGYGKRVNASLKGVQFVRDGDSFGGGTPPAGVDDFAVIEGADAGDLA